MWWKTLLIIYAISISYELIGVYRNRHKKTTENTNQESTRNISVQNGNVNKLIQNTDKLCDDAYQQEVQKSLKSTPLQEQTWYWRISMPF